MKSNPLLLLPAASLGQAKEPHRFGFIGFALPQQDGGKLRVMGAIGAMLCFQADSAVLLVGNAAFAPLSTQKITGIELQGRFCGEDGEPPSSYGVTEFRRRVQRI